MVEAIAIADGARAEVDPSPGTEVGIERAAEAKGTAFAEAGAFAWTDQSVRARTFARRCYFKLRFGGEIHYRWTFLSELEIRRGDRVLEISVGTGANLPILPAGALLHGLDASSAALREAARHLKEWGTEAALIRGEAEHLPFRGGSFDCVYRIGGLADFRDPREALREMIRVAKSGTKLLIADEVNRGSRERKSRHSRANESGYEPPVVTMLPAGMLDVEYEEVCKGSMYRLTFRKP